jgi:hypothetical protein
VGLLGLEFGLGLGQGDQGLGDLAKIGRVSANLSDPDAAFAVVECSAHVFTSFLWVCVRASSRP